MHIRHFIQSLYFKSFFILILNKPLICNEIAKKFHKRLDFSEKYGIIISVKTHREEFIWKCLENLIQSRSM